MNETLTTANFKINQPIRTINFQGLSIGGDKSFNFLSENENKSKPLFALELNIFDFSVSSHVVKDYFCENIAKIDVMLNSFQHLTSERPCETETNSVRLEIASLIVTKAQESDCDILALKFNIGEEDLDEQVKAAQELLKRLLPQIKKPLIIRGVNNKSIDVKLLPALMEVLDREVIIAFADENTYKQIVPPTVKGGHILAIRTPIDINLAKEMNILTSDLGLSLDKILIDTDMGGLGYGLEYGYSIMERIKLAAFEGDSMLNMPLIAFAGEEALKVKETKTDAMPKSWGDFKTRSMMFEITTAAAVIAAGANLVVLEHPVSIQTLKNMFGGQNG